MLRQVVCVDRVKDVTCYVMGYCMAGIGQMRSSGNGGGSRRNTCFRLQALATKKKH